MPDLYSDIAQVYDKCGVNAYSISFGKAILKYLNVIHPDETFKRNLDICCGTGTLCGFFKDNGIETKGVDISREMLDIARQKYPDIEFIEHDVVQYHDDKTYDFITCVDDALGHITDIEDVKKVIGNANGLLRTNGLFIFDMLNFDSIPIDKFDKSLDESSRLSYNIHGEGDLIRIDLEYYEHDKRIWKNGVWERDYSVDEITKIFNGEGFIMESCSQEFFNENIFEKWKIVFRKIE